MNKLLFLLFFNLFFVSYTAFSQEETRQPTQNIPADFDNDGLTNDIDIDDDNDGIPDTIESGGIDPLTDADHDGVPVYIDDDDHDFNVGDVDGLIQPGFDYDNDGWPNFVDLDSDNDGLFDAAESGRFAGDDANFDGMLDNPVGMNGLADVLESSPDSGILTYSIQNNDAAFPISDTNPDFIDKDDDNDNVLTTNENPDANHNGYPDDAQDTDGGGSADYLDPDDDGDGIDTIWEDIALPNNYPQDGNPMDDDTDLDGIPNYLDPDDDNDGTPTVDEHPDDNNNGIPDDALDSDHDGTPDYLDPIYDPFDHDNDGIRDNVDIDDDNDGIPDLQELNGLDPLADADNDGIPAYLDDDDNNNAIGDANNHTEVAYDTDYDNIPNQFDLDSDGDGLFDLAESGHTTGSDTNHDGMVDGFVGTNGLPDSVETAVDSGIINYTLQDTDVDTIYDFLDADDDNDHVPTQNEYADFNGDHYPNDAMDTDMDTLPNYLDPDDDGDGLYTIYEDVQLPNNYPQDGDPTNDDTDGDGIPNYLDVDDDNDGLLTINEQADPNGNHEPEDAVDTDGDGIPDYLDDYENANDHDNDHINDDVDIDDDNDGIPDIAEYNGIDPDADADNDGVPAYLDDDDHDNTLGDTNGHVEPQFDLDNDGIPNHFDLDSDGDGLFDLAESGSTGYTDANLDGRVDDAVGANGLADVLETAADSGTINYTIQDTDHDTSPDFLDFDDDNDHVLTINEHPDDNGNHYPDDALHTDFDGIPNYLDRDDDGDGLYTDFEDIQLPNDYPQDGNPMNDDTDGDGTPNYLDNDDDNDSILTINEHPDDNGNHEPEDAIDSDGDGIPDYLDDHEDANDHDNDGIADNIDIDDDNDGIPDLMEYGGIDPLTDADNDGVPVYLDDDDNDNTVGDDNHAVETAFDFDGDGTPNHFDVDSDGDGLADAAESGRLSVPVGTDVQPDGILEGNVGANGLVDDLETTPDSGIINYTLQDSDNDSHFDFLDADDDNDHVLTINEFPDFNNNRYPDDAMNTDLDAFPNYLDPDDDGDGLYTIYEDVELPNHYPQDGNPMNDDTDGDGIANYLDNDDDGDGILTINEHPDPNGNHEPEDAVDTDGDGIPDYLDANENPNDHDNDGISDDIDIDDDNDGIPDVAESGGIDPLTDADNDGIPVYLDDDDNDNTIGDDNGIVEPQFDLDNDGIPNHFDLDSDGDGLFDLAESGANTFTDANFDGRVDDAVGTNGLADVLETSPDSGTINYTLLDTDHDTSPDFLDFDDDDDHVPTNAEFPDFNANGYPEDAMDTDLDGTPNYLDPDDDGDGLYTIYEDVALPNDYPQDGNPMNDDTDGDGIANYLDVDDDNDGLLTINEQADPNGNHEPEDAVDSDGDGIPDYLDAIDNSLDFDGDGVNNDIDIDDDNDGIPDVDEYPSGLNPFADADNDGVPAFKDDDDNNNAIGDDNHAAEPAYDADGDGQANHLDVSSDTDNLYDHVESGRLSVPIGTDANNDGMLEGAVGANGLVDELETAPDSGILTYTLQDTDNDGLIDPIDNDDDNDHVLSLDEFPDSNANHLPDDAMDTDLDGIPNYLDPDDDGDGLYTIYEDVALPNNYPQDGNPMNDDTDHDGIANYLDNDDDNDGILTINEHPDDNGNHEPEDALDSNHNTIPDYLDANDFDQDGVNDIVDLDDDNDGIPDVDESGGIDPLTDADHDGYPVFVDDDDNDNTIGDANGMIEPGFDIDNDGIPNHFDVNSDNDILFDTAESGRLSIPVGTDADFDGVLEGAVGANGIIDELETSPDSGVLLYNVLNTDTDSKINALDDDDDNDHVLTNDEQPDVNNDGYPEDALDTDGDLIPNYLDRDDDGDGLYTDFEDVALPNDYPQDGNPMNDDTDDDGIPNYLDNDDDDDGLLTIDEHADDNGNHEPEDARDTDGDGIPDYLDDYDNRELEIFTAISPNGNGKNDFMFVKSVEKFPDNKMTILDRWQNKVWEGRNYDNVNVRFEGKDKKDMLLPTGTYFYIFEYKDDGKNKTKAGYLYLLK